MNARESALLVLREIEQQGIKSEQSLHRHFRRHDLERNESALATELVNGVLRRRLLLDFVISRHYHHDIAKAAPVLRALLRIGAYQLLFLDRIPAWSAVDECVKLAKKYKGRHLAGVVNAVLRKIPKDRQAAEEPLRAEPPAKRLSIASSHPEWLVLRWLERYGEEKTLAMLSANNEPPMTGLRVNTLKTSPDTMRKAFRDAGVTALETGMDRFLLTRDFTQAEPFVRLGLVTVQNPTQALPCLLLGALPGNTVLDMCAAPGGKSTFLGELMQNKGRIIALDRYPNKCEKIARRAESLGITIIETLAGDALEAAGGEHPDAILLDAPCTGSGVLARRPDLRWRITPARLDELTALQARLLDRAAELLRPEGILVYSTCSVEEEENRRQIDRFLERHPDFMRERAPQAIPEVFSERENGPGSCLTLPGEHEGFDGGFAQRLRKRR